MPAATAVKRKKKVRAIVCDDKTWEELREMSNETNFSMSVLIRLMIKEYKAKMERKEFLN